MHAHVICYFTAVSVSVSGWTLVAISVERFYAIRHPFVSETNSFLSCWLPVEKKRVFLFVLQTSRKWQTRSHARHIILAVWLASFAIMSPVAVLSELKPAGRDGKHFNANLKHLRSVSTLLCYSRKVTYFAPFRFCSSDWRNCSQFNHS